MIKEHIPFVYEIENNLSIDFCDQLINLYEYLKENGLERFINLPNDLLVNKGHDNNIKSYEDIYISKLLFEDISDDIKEHISKIDKTLFDRLTGGLYEFYEKTHDLFFLDKFDWYNDLHDDKILSKRRFRTFCSDSGYQIQRCGGDLKGFKLHDDANPELVFDNSKIAYGVRSLTFTWYLNDNFEDGGTYFPYSNFTYIPKQGSLLFFPSFWTHSHIGFAPKQKFKYICTGWMHHMSHNNMPGFRTGFTHDQVNFDT